MDSLPCTILIPCAGSSARFSSKTAMPKALLRFHYKGRFGTMLSHIAPSFKSAQNFVAIVCRNSQSGFFDEIPYRLVSIARTIGQADTVRQGAFRVMTDLLVINCDNVIDADKLEEFVVFCRGAQAKVGAVVFKASSERYGYVDDFPYFINGAEKSPISDYALAGAFYFQNSQMLSDAFSAAARSLGDYEGELYLSHLFRYLPAPKAAYLIEKHQLHEWGTPEQLEVDPTVLIDWSKQE